jgi:hypothetical protein
VLQTAVQAGADEKRLFSMMSMAATDHFYINGGHTLDSRNMSGTSSAIMSSLFHTASSRAADRNGSPMYPNWHESWKH